MSVTLSREWTTSTLTVLYSKEAWLAALGKLEWRSTTYHLHQLTTRRWFRIPPTQPVSLGVPQEIVDAHAALRSHWSKDSRSEISSPLAEEVSYGPQWTKPFSCGETWALDTPAISTSSDSERSDFPVDLDAHREQLINTYQCEWTSFRRLRTAPTNSRAIRKEAAWR